MAIATTPMSDVVTAIRQELQTSESLLWLLDDTDVEGWVVAGMRLCASELNNWNYSVEAAYAGNAITPSIDLSGPWGNALICATLLRASQGNAITSAFENFGDRMQGGLSESSTSVAEQQRRMAMRLEIRWDAAKQALAGYKAFRFQSVG